MVAQASRPPAGSLAQNFAHCGSGGTRSTFEGAAGVPGAAGLAGVCCAKAPPASATLTARAAALARMTWNLINRPLELLKAIVLRSSCPLGPAIGVGKPPGDLMTQGAVNARRIGAPLFTFDATFQ